MERIGQYVVEQQLGAGGMGVVYRVRGPGKKAFALKIIKFDERRPVSKEEFKTAAILFMRETEILARLRHPNIVRLVDKGRDELMFYMVVELLPGGDLASYLQQKGQPSHAAILRLLRQIADGLEYAHRQQIIHRDLKPQNILITADEIPKIADFGLAKAASAYRVRGERTARLMGTLFFMAPEQMQLSDEVTPAADVYALALIAYWMLSGGQHPFQPLINLAQVRNEDELIAHLIKVTSLEQFVPITEFNRTLPRWVNDVIAKGLAAAPARRYQSARALVQDLEYALTGNGTVVLPPDGVEDEGPSDEAFAEQVRAWETKRLSTDPIDRNHLLLAGVAALSGVGLALGADFRALSEHRELMERARVYAEVAEVLAAELAIPLADAMLLVLEALSERSSTRLMKLLAAAPVATSSATLGDLYKTLLGVRVRYAMERPMESVLATLEIYLQRGGAPVRRTVETHLPWHKAPDDIRASLLRGGAPSATIFPPPGAGA